MFNGFKVRLLKAMVADGYSAAIAVPVCDILLKIWSHYVIIWLLLDIFYFLWFEFNSQLTEKKFLSGMYHVLNYPYSQF